MTDSASAGYPTPPPASEPDKADRFTLIGSSVEALADLAPALSGIELKVILELARQQLRGAGAVCISSRDLAKRCRLGRSNVVMAIDALTASGHLTTRQGTTAKPATYQVNTVQTLQMGGPISGPPPAERWSQNNTSLVLFQDQGGPDLTPPPTENTALTAAAGAVDISTASLAMIDRVLSAKPKDFDPNDIAVFRGWLHKYRCKLGRDERGKPTPNAHPPKDDLVAQFLSIADPRRLGGMLDSLMCDHKDCYSYGWFVTVALQRIHGIHWTETQKARAALRDVKARPAPAPAAEQTGLDFARGIVRQAVAGSKAVAVGRKLR